MIDRKILGQSIPSDLARVAADDGRQDFTQVRLLLAPLQDIAANPVRVGGERTSADRSVLRHVVYRGQVAAVQEVAIKGVIDGVSRLVRHGRRLFQVGGETLDPAFENDELPERQRV